jgi:hypothetical protein
MPLVVRLFVLGSFLVDLFGLVGRASGFAHRLAATASDTQHAAHRNLGGTY